MKHSSSAMQDFEFHDAEFELISCGNGQLVVQATHLNIHWATLQNDHPTDMEITLARITFRDFRAVSFEPGRVWKQDAQGHSYPVGPLIVYEGAQAQERLLHELHHGTTVFEFAHDGSGVYHLDGCGDEPWFTAQFAFSGMLVEWDEYRGPAWYSSGKTLHHL